MIDQEIFEERAAIVEFDGLLSKEEAEKQGALESEAYRHACEVRTIAEWPLQDRRDYIDQVEKKRGKKSAESLKDSLLKMWEEKSLAQIKN